MISKRNKRIIDYIVLSVSEFAKQKDMKTNEAYAFLNEYKGIDFLINCYDAEHTVGIDDIIDDLGEVCHRYGGDLK